MPPDVSPLQEVWPMRTAECNMFMQVILELRSEARGMKNGLDSKIDQVAKRVPEAFQGFVILDPDEELWTEQQVHQLGILFVLVFNFRHSLAILVLGAKIARFGNR